MDWVLINYYHIFPFRDHPIVLIKKRSVITFKTHTMLERTPTKDHADRPTQIKISDAPNKQIFYFNGENDRHFYRLIPDLVGQNIYFWHLI